MSSTHFPNGVTNVPEYATLGSFILPDPSTVHMYFNDFDIYTATDWLEVASGAATEAIVANGDGGQLLITNTAADNDFATLRLANVTFLLDKAKSFWMKGRLKVSDVLETDILFGLMDTMAAFNPTNGIYVFKDDGAVPLRLSLEKAGVQTPSFSASSATGQANDTFVEVGITYDANEGIVKAWLGGQPFAQIADLTNFPNTVAVAPAFGIRNGEAVAKTMTMDYVLFAKQR